MDRPAVLGRAWCAWAVWLAVGGRAEERVTVEEAARATCALHWTGLNLTPLLAPVLLRAGASASATVDPAQHLAGEALQRFSGELERLRRLRAEGPGDEDAPYEVRQCYAGAGQGGASFAPSFDFAYNASHDDTHLLVEEAVIQALGESATTGAAGGRRVLSLGCGDGRWASRYAAAAMGPSDELALLDLHGASLDAAAKLTKASVQLRSVETFESDLNGETLGDALARSGGGGGGPFDVIESSLMMHHVEDLTGLLQSVSAHLAPAGRLVLLDVVDSNVLEEAMLRKVHAYVPPFHGVEFFRNHTDLLDQVSSVGLEVLEYRRLDPAVLFLVAARRASVGGGGAAAGGGEHAASERASAEL